MKAGVEVSGLDEALRRINAEIGTIKKNAQAGLWEASLKILGVAQKDRLAPIYRAGPTNDNYKLTGNLRASGYVRSASGTERPSPSDLVDSENEPIPSDALPPIGVEIGFTARYARRIHEDLETSRAPKFLESVIVDNERQIIDIVKKRSGADG